MTNPAPRTIHEPCCRRPHRQYGVWQLLAAVFGAGKNGVNGPIQSGLAGNGTYNTNESNLISKHISIPNPYNGAISTLARAYGPSMKLP